MNKTYFNLLDEYTINYIYKSLFNIVLDEFNTKSQTSRQGRYWIEGLYDAINNYNPSYDWINTYPHYFHRLINQFKTGRNYYTLDQIDGEIFVLINPTEDTWAGSSQRDEYTEEEVGFTAYKKNYTEIKPVHHLVYNIYHKIYKRKRRYNLIHGIHQLTPVILSQLLLEERHIS